MLEVPWRGGGASVPRYLGTLLITVEILSCVFFRDSNVRGSRNNDNENIDIRRLVLRSLM